MMTRISFMSANYAARVLGHQMAEQPRTISSFWEGWARCSRATNDHFAPLGSFGQRFEELLVDVCGLGFQAVDIWGAHLDWRWATVEHIATARDLLGRHGLSVASYVGGGGKTRDEFVTACQLARSLDTEVLQGGTPLLLQDRDFVVATLKQYGLRLGIHKFPEKGPQEMRDQIGDGGDGTIGTVLDTGGYASHGHDPAQAIEYLGEHVIHVHLKDVLAPGSHESCRYGQGCVPIDRCVRALVDMGYQGYYCVEHEPLGFDPSDDCRADLVMLRRLLGD